MKRSISAPKGQHILSSPNLPHVNKNSQQTLLQHSNQEQLIQHRKEIQSTLNQLHRLQSQIYELNVPQNPHSTSPVKKQIKQLSYLYQNMTKPKIKNNLSVRSDDIQLAMRIMNNDWTPDTILQPEINEESQFNRKGNQVDLLGKTKANMFGNTVSNNNQSSQFRNTIKQQTNSNFNAFSDRSYKIPKKVLQQKFQSLSHTSLNPSFISKNQKSQTISTKQLYQFINYTQCEDFDPIKKAYEMFLNEEGEFDLSIYNSFNQILGLPKIKNLQTFVTTINYSKDKIRQFDQKNEEQELKNLKYTSKNSAKISLQQFKKILQLQI